MAKSLSIYFLRLYIIFIEQFWCHSKIGGKGRDFPCTPCCPPTVHVPHRLARRLRSMTLHWHVIVTWSRQLAGGFVPGGVRPVGVDGCLVPRVPHHSVTRASPLLWKCPVLRPSVLPAPLAPATSELCTVSSVGPFPEQHVFGITRRAAASDRPLSLRAMPKTPPRPLGSGARFQPTVDRGPSVCDRSPDRQRTTAVDFFIFKKKTRGCRKHPLGSHREPGSPSPCVRPAWGAPLLLVNNAPWRLHSLSGKNRDHNVTRVFPSSSSVSCAEKEGVLFFGTCVTAVPR